MQVKDQVQMLLVQDLLDTLSKNMDILPYRFEGFRKVAWVWFFWCTKSHDFTPKDSVVGCFLQEFSI